MTGARVVCVAPTEWNGPWQRYHEIARRLAAAGNDVLVLDGLYRVDLPRVRTPGEAVAIAARAASLLGRARRRAVAAAPGLTVHTVTRAPRGDGARRTLLAHVQAHLAARAPGPVLLWCGFPTPLWPALRDAVRPRALWYDCASAFADDPALRDDVRQAESALVAAADAVTVDARGLRDRHASAARSCTWIPTGVDTTLFARAGAVRRPREDAAAPVVGYVGTLHAWLDYVLIADVARAEPRWRFVFVGPTRLRADLSVLRGCPNVELAGSRPHETLPEALAAFDVAWIPYRLAPFTQAVFPTKLLEYLAAGCAVVSTPLPEVQAFAPPVRLASSSAETASAVRAGLADPRRDAARAAALPYDWDRAMATLHGVLDGAIGG